MKKFFLSTGFTFVVLTITFWIFVLQFSPLDQRTPASVENDLTIYSGEQLWLEMKKTIASELTVVLDNTELSLTVGNFRFLDKGNQVRWGCEVYDRIRYRFVADSAVDGNITSMEIESKCLFVRGEGATRPARVPLKTIYDEYEPNDGDIQFNLDVPVTISFANLPGSFPKKWYLDSVEMAESGGSNVQLTAADLASFKKNFVIE